MDSNQRDADDQLENEDHAIHASQAYSMADRGQLPAQDEELNQIAPRLWKKYGPGDKPELRKLLFGRIEREAIAYGGPVTRIIHGAVRSAETANDPGRYFCATVVRRLKEAGFMQPQESLW